MKNIDLIHPIDLKKLLNEYNLTKENIKNFSIGYDNKIYILVKENIDDKKYSLITLEFDWDSCKLINQVYYDLGIQNPHFPLIQPIENNLLLIGTRTKKQNENAIILDYQGNVIKKFYVGDAIEDCIVTESGNIITSYFDEALSRMLIIWDENGKVIWETNREICDCYAINIDENNKLWYYYYVDFLLIQTDMKEEKVFNPNIEYSHGFLVTSDNKNVIFDGGIRNIKTFMIGKINTNEINNYKQLNLLYNGKNIAIKQYKFRQSKAVFIDDLDRLFIKRF